MELVEEAIISCARQSAAYRVIGLNPSTIQRWKISEMQHDQRSGPKTQPRNALTKEERGKVLQLANSAELRDKSPKQFVPLLADRGVYVCSKSTMPRILRSEEQVQHRETSKPAEKRSRPNAFVAFKANEVWTWDNTYLRAPVRGTFYYLYLMLDIWSRKIVGWEVHEEEGSSNAAKLIESTCLTENVSSNTLVLHSDNGGPMKGGTTLAKLQELGIAASFSRPSVSNNSPFSESCFRTVQYRPNFPSKPFESIEAARI